MRCVILDKQDLASWRARPNFRTPMPSHTGCILGKGCCNRKMMLLWQYLRVDAGIGSTFNGPRLGLSYILLSCHMRSASGQAQMLAGHF